MIEKGKRYFLFPPITETAAGGTFEGVIRVVRVIEVSEYTPDYGSSENPEEYTLVLFIPEGSAGVPCEAMRLEDFEELTVELYSDWLK